MARNGSSGAVRVGVIGCGNISRAHARGYKALDQIQVVAVCDTSATAAVERGAELGVSAIYHDHRALLEDARVEAVDVCLPHHLHAEIAVAAARAGKHVFVEKPMASSYAEALAMVEAARAGRVVLMVGHHQRYIAEHRRLKEMIDAGELGEIICARADCNQYLLHYTSRTGLSEKHWLHSATEAGGGAVISLSVHKLDLLRWFVGEVEAVTSFQRTALVPMSGEDVSVANLRFASGCLGEMVSLYAAKKSPWGESFILYGSRGSAHNLGKLGSYASPVVVWREGKDSDYCPIEVPKEDPFANELGHFADCVRTGRTPLTNGEDAAKTMQLIAAIYRSAESGAVVPVSQVTG